MLHTVGKVLAGAVDDRARPRSRWAVFAEPKEWGGERGGTDGPSKLQGDRDHAAPQRHHHLGRGLQRALGRQTGALGGWLPLKNLENEVERGSVAISKLVGGGGIDECALRA